jgi:hypothetical protein
VWTQLLVSQESEYVFVFIKQSACVAGCVAACDNEIADQPMSDQPVDVHDISPVVITIPLPLVVLERCQSTYQLAVWVALRWLLAAYPVAEGFSYAQIGKRAGVDREEVGRLLAELLRAELIVKAGSAKVRHTPGERERYSIDLAELVQMSVLSVYDVLSRWNVRKAKPYPKEQHALQLDDTTSGYGIMSQMATSGYGITSDSATSGYGITSPSQFLAVKAPDVLETVISLPLPIIVLERCTPSQLCTWISMYWWKQALPKGRRPSIVQVAKRGMVGRGRVQVYQHELFELGLAVIAGQDGKDGDVYAISDYEINQLMAMELPKILSNWKIKQHPHRTRNEQQLSFFASPVTSGYGITSDPATSGNGITSGESARVDAPATSGYGITPDSATSGYGITSDPATSGYGIISADLSPSLKRKKLKKGVVNDPIQDSFATPDGQPSLHDHPLGLWQRLHPEATAADRERLRRTAAEHDLPHRAYGGDFGMYWLGRAIEATLANTTTTPTLRYVRCILRSWRERTTDEVSAYGSDAPNYRPRQHTGYSRGLTVAASNAAPAQIPPDLQALWAGILEAVQQQLPAADFATWLRDSALLQLDATAAVIGVSNIFVRDRVAQDYASVLAAALSTALDRPITLEIVIDGRLAR